MVYLWFASLFACDDTTFKAHFASVDGEGVEAVVEVFEGNCVDCHMGESGSAGLALDGNFCDTTVNVESVSGTGLLIVPGSKEDSVLYQRIVDASRPMPPTGVMAENNTINIAHVPDEIKATESEEAHEVGSLAGIGLDRLEKEADKAI